MPCKVFEIDRETDVHLLLSRVQFLIEELTQDRIIITESVIVCSELVYNIIKYGNNGSLSLEVNDHFLNIEALDYGEGFRMSLEQAFIEGVSTSGSLGLGMASVVRLCYDFTLQTSSSGTCIRCTKSII